MNNCKCNCIVDKRPYIVKGYRPAMNWEQASCSIVGLHNETCNIWTHLIPAFVSAYLLFLWHREPVVAAYCACMTIMFSTSTLYHTFNVVGPSGPVAPVSSFHTFYKLDITGILILMWGSNLPIVYYGFSCGKDSTGDAYFKIGTIVVLAAISRVFSSSSSPSASFVVPLICVTSLAFVEFIHEYLFYYSPFMDVVLSMNVQVFGSYFLGVVFYTSMIPERWMPGRFDFFLNSHNWWHLCVIMGAFLHYRSVIQYHHHYASVCLCG